MTGSGRNGTEGEPKKQVGKPRIGILCIKHQASDMPPHPDTMEARPTSGQGVLGQSYDLGLRIWVWGHI